MLFHKMLASKIPSVVGLIILANNVKTQNNKNRSILIRRQDDVYMKNPATLSEYEEINDGNVSMTNAEMDSLYNEHARLYGLDKLKKYEAEKYFVTFMQNVILIDRLHAIYNTAKFSINAYTHLTLKQFTDKYTGFNSTGLTNDDVILFNTSIVQNLPPVMDWSTMLEKYTQHNCKNSYVLSALSNIEAQYLASNGYQTPGYLSIRQAFECERHGSCEYGGVPHYVFKALKESGGVSRVHEYPYFDQPNIKAPICQTPFNEISILIDHYIRLKVNKEDDLQYVLAYYGPVVTTIYVSDTIRHYSSGVLDPGDCGDNESNHAVLLDGYGVDTDTNLAYWHVKSSWVRWGTDGHIRLRRGGGFVCNLGREYIATSFVKRAKPSVVHTDITQKLIKTLPTKIQSQSQPTLPVIRKNAKQAETPSQPPPTPPVMRRNAKALRMPTLPPRGVRTKGIFESIKFYR